MVTSICIGWATSASGPGTWVKIKSNKAGFEDFDLQQLQVNPVLFGIGIDGGKAVEAMEALDEVGKMKELRKQHKIKDRGREARESLQIIFKDLDTDDFKKIMEFFGRKPDEDNFIPGWRLKKLCGIKSEEKEEPLRQRPESGK
jgi:hypothetical protein